MADIRHAARGVNQLHNFVEVEQDERGLERVPDEGCTVGSAPGDTSAAATTAVLSPIENKRRARKVTAKSDFV